MHKIIEKALKNIFDFDNDITISYDAIPDIQDTQHLEAIKTLLYSQEETTMDKLILKQASL